MVNEEWEQGLEMVSTSLEALPSFAPGFLRKGHIFEKLDRLAEVRKAYERVIELDDGHALALNNYAYFLVENYPTASPETLQLAMRLAKRAVAIGPNGARYDTLGWVYFRMGDYAMAIGALEQGLSEQKDRSTEAWPAL